MVCHTAKDITTVKSRSEVTLRIGLKYKEIQHIVLGAVILGQLVHFYVYIWKPKKVVHSMTSCMNVLKSNCILNDKKIAM